MNLGQGAQSESEEPPGGWFKVRINGIEAALEVATVLGTVIDEINNGQRNGIAVAINSAVIPRSAWDVTVLRAGDVIEILTAAQGG